MKGKKQKLSWTNAALTATVMLAAFGCTRERPYEEVLKEHVQARNLLPENVDYIYLPSTENSPRTNSASRPHWMGETKIVRFRYSEKSLDILEQDPEERFADNIANQKPVLSIPATYVDYKCVENSIGECSNKEQEDDKTPWQQKSNVKLDLTAMSVREVNTLPLQIQEAFGMGGCFQEQGSRVLEAKLSTDSVNIRVERTFKADPFCLGNDFELNDLSFNVIHHYALVRRDTAVTKGYQPVPYPYEDQNEFGFFTTETRRLSIDNRDRTDGQQFFLNRFNPAAKEVVYHLSDNFSKPGYEGVKKATYEAFKYINEGLAKSGASMRLKLEEPSGKVPGDLRANMIVMVEDPMAGGLLGYGPSAADPRTGEIINAKTVMYVGVLKKYLRVAWDEIIELRRQAEAKPETPPAAGGSSQASGMGPVASLMTELAAASGAKLATSSSIDSDDAFVRGLRSAPAPLRVSRPSRGSHSGRHSDMALVKGAIRDYTKFATKAEDQISELTALNRYSVTPIDLVNLEDAVTTAIQDRFQAEDLKPWEQLSEAQRGKIVDTLISYIYLPVLIHEVGHNLGLRHNFKGSEDKANWYSKEESEALGMTSATPYSSVMDYAFRDLNQLRHLGKYDIAALRFAYARKIELADGSIVPISGTVKDFKASLAQGQAMKEFGFCTDEHVDVNAGCKRFDEGTTLSELASHWVRFWESKYRWRNFRNGDRSFSYMDDRSHASRLEDVFFNLRLMLEQRDRIQQRFQLTDEQWASEEFLKDLDEAAKIAGDFMLKVLATPDVTCYLVDARGAQPRPVVVPLSAINADAISCFGLKLVPKVTVLAEAGKSFASKKDPSNPNPWADQIDVRGIWIDKFLASKYLLNRKLGVSLLDETTGSYVGYKDFGDKIANQLRAIVSNSLSGPVEFRAADGETVSINLNYSLDIENAQLVQQIPSSGLRESLGLPAAGDVLLSKELSAAAVRETPYLLDNSNVAPFVEAFRVYKLPLITPVNEAELKAADAKVTVIGSTRYIALPGNEVARGLITDLAVVRVLDQVKPEELQALLAQLAAPAPGPAPTDAPAPQAERPEIAAARALGPAVIQKFLQGGYEEQGFYSLRLEQMLSDASRSLEDIAQETATAKRRRR